MTAVTAVTAWRRSALAAVVGLGALGCGYQPLHSAREPAGPFTVIGAQPKAPSSEAAAAAEAGARSELSRAGALATPAEARAGSSAVEVELLRVDEEAAGIAVDAASGAPIGRGLRVTVTGRARLWGSGGRSELLRDTGDVRASLVISREQGNSGGQDGQGGQGGQGDAAAASAAVRDAARLAGRRLGERLARRILGLPDAGGE